MHTSNCLPESSTLASSSHVKPTRFTTQLLMCPPKPVPPSVFSILVNSTKLLRPNTWELTLIPFLSYWQPIYQQVLLLLSPKQTLHLVTSQHRQYYSLALTFCLSLFCYIRIFLFPFLSTYSLLIESNQSGKVHCINPTISPPCFIPSNCFCLCPSLLQIFHGSLLIISTLSPSGRFLWALLPKKQPPGHSTFHFPGFVLHTTLYILMFCIFICWYLDCMCPSCCNIKREILSHLFRDPQCLEWWRIG